MWQLVDPALPCHKSEESYRFYLMFLSWHWLTRENLVYDIMIWELEDLKKKECLWTYCVFVSKHWIYGKDWPNFIYY